MTSAASRFASRGSRTRSGATDAKFHGQKRDPDHANQRSYDRRTGDESSEDRRCSACKQDEQGHEKVAQVAGDDIRLCGPEEDGCCDRSRAENEG